MIFYCHCDYLHGRCTEMTKLLREAFEKASELPDVEQNALAKWLMEELAADREWAGRFAESEDVLDRLADEALDAHHKGHTTEMDTDRL
jgi:hypothetical protein